ncbi:MAG: GNAT family N-acetyltransferase [Ignavibacteriota bacterium]|jgi:diamine N-acetyltransferase|nr:MAG: N-acetyltransferase [Chlorobiota bacterium]MBE7475514.1 GNAT family N-acetyltransferase [Ignavibacteriales bacterium]MBL1122474.1 N-acetyltransferase [Ignavibacteriota bacterium]MCC7094298.1 GNAT family N-acetyltransferase [Ignavibacteriaceae bacterium]MCE7856583.1 N-acetyltransferase [Ignavibacteria bacterium CHB3]MEB2297211.1 GNAT family protein [Ignavibacteria bacterium]
MNDYELKIKDDITVNTISKAILNETSKLGFKRADYISLVNNLLDVSINNSISEPKVKSETDVKTSKLKFPIRGERIQLRLFNPKHDYDIIQNWLNDNTSRWFLLDRSSYRDKTLIEIINDEENIFGIISLPDNTPIGLMAFLNYDQTNCKAEMRKLIGEKIYRGKGYAKEATMLWIKYGTRNLGLKKIYLNTIENNIRNITLNRELGFQIEGLLRKEFLINDQYYDVLRMAYIVED